KLFDRIMHFRGAVAQDESQRARVHVKMTLVIDIAVQLLMLNFSFILGFPDDHKEEPMDGLKALAQAVVLLRRISQLCVIWYDMPERESEVHLENASYSWTELWNEKLKPYLMLC